MMKKGFTVVPVGKVVENTVTALNVEVNAC